jgi:hypothetical protein
MLLLQNNAAQVWVGEDKRSASFSEEPRMPHEAKEVQTVLERNVPLAKRRQYAPSSV